MRKKGREAAPPPTAAQLEQELRRETYRRRYSRVLRSTIYTLITVAAALVFTLVVFLLPSQCMSIFTSEQPVIAAGADYLAPYYNRMENLNIQASQVIQNLAAEIKRVHSDSKILAASFKNVSQVLQAINQGAQAVTIGPDVVAQSFSMPSIQKAIDDFSQDWQSIYQDSCIHDLS